MQALEERLKKLIESKLAGGLADLETLPDRHVCGHVISSEFEGKDYGVRRKRLRELFDNAKREGLLTDDELLKISTLLTYTPQEWNVATAE